MRLIDSIYDYDIENDYILSRPSIDTIEFEDITPVELGMENEVLAIRRQLNDDNVISYIRRLKNCVANNSFVIVINISYNHLLTLLQICQKACSVH